MFEGDLCSCCMATEDLLELSESPKDLTDAGNYADIVKSCFGIKLSKEDGHESICLHCVAELKVAFNFKNKTLQSIKKLTSMKVRTRASKLVVHEVQCADHANRDVLVTVEILDDSIFTDEQEFASSSKSDTPSEEVNTFEPEIKKRAISGRYKKPSALPYTLHSKERRCRECAQDFTSYAALKMHYNVHFPLHKCDTCDKGFVEALSLKKHQLTHAKGPFRCNICEKEYNKINTLQRHRRMYHSKEPSYECNVCGDKFATYNRRVKHLSDCHGVDVHRYNCGACDCGFDSKKELKEHNKSLHPKAPLPCTMCEYKSTDRRCLTHHMTNKHGVGTKNYACEHCGKMFSRKNSLDVHCRSHDGDWKSRRVKVRLPCTMCKFTSTDRRCLTEHMMNKHGVGTKKHACEHCGKKFSRKHTLDIHCRSHTGDRRSACKLCGKRFITKYNLKHHVESHIRKSHYDGDPEDLMGESKFEDMAFDAAFGGGSDSS